MGATNGIGLVWPELTDSADGPDAFSKLANGVEDYFFDRILPSGVTRYPSFHWGTGSGSFPSGTLVKAGDTFTRSDWGATFRYDGANWTPITAFGMKLWRTAGFSQTIPVNDNTITVDYQSSRGQGGFTPTVTPPAAVGQTGITVPMDGVYRLAMRTYMSGGSAHEGTAYFIRRRASVADYTNTAVNSLWKTNTVTDSIHMMYDRVPLLAGDKILHKIYVTAGTTTYYGTTEHFGCMMMLDYYSPLNGATPV